MNCCLEGKLTLYDTSPKNATQRLASENDALGFALIHYLGAAQLASVRTAPGWHESGVLATRLGIYIPHFEPIAGPRLECRSSWDALNGWIDSVNYGPVPQLITQDRSGQEKILNLTCIYPRTVVQTIHYNLMRMLQENKYAT